VGGFFLGAKKLSLGYKKKEGACHLQKSIFLGKKGLPYFEGGKKKVEFTIFRP